MRGRAPMVQEGPAARGCHLPGFTEQLWLMPAMLQPCVPLAPETGVAVPAAWGLLLLGQITLGTFLAHEAFFPSGSVKQ